MDDRGRLVLPADFRKRLDGLNIEIKQIDKAHDARVAKAAAVAEFAHETV